MSGVLGENGGRAAPHVVLALAQEQEQLHSQQKMEVLHARDQQLKRRAAVKVHAKVRGCVRLSLSLPNTLPLFLMSGGVCLT